MPEEKILEEDISYHRKKFSVRGRNPLSEQEISFRRKKFCCQRKIQRKTFLVRGRSFFPAEEICWQRKKFLVAGFIFLSKG